MPQILSVSDITEQIKRKLEDEIPEALVRAEISECKYHSSGHIYLVLKDPGAILPAVIWRTTALQLPLIPAVGMDVIVYGRLSVYAPHGKYQFVIQSLQDAGRGELYRKFEDLKRRLVEEGLCDSARKKAIPPYPLHVGLVTSETGAALQDMLRIFAHDAAHVRLTLAPARVQGKGAANSVISALRSLIPLKPDCVILARGGGSIEDLWEFNDEDLARFIAAYPIPLISGIGHETDSSIADFVSDHRASTPTNAAEFICKSWRDVRTRLNVLDDTLNTRADWYLDSESRRLKHIQQILALHSPIKTLLTHQQKLGDLLSRSAAKLSAVLQLQEQSGKELSLRLFRGLGAVIRYRTMKYEGLKAKLEAYAPKHILRKGYVLLRDKQAQLIRSASELQCGDAVQIELHDGSAEAMVSEIKNKGSDQNEQRKKL
ncbi:MAG: exodeoxyribonuclease VII large subunit [Candidatus Marinimicrobia bacterium]|jgi:exodeoxyribonuclease VII large subunit|nr:exodeoxyribonuclease VII large subunit [Candidatus Neomarinimicrobiota bacterium]MDD4961733.1 exodeoxyribonuclease VII large subunit [Candidatus Neomarinimicrobiota bacterium]MDD5710404.1 exodeoxyribonuclease VII large subunit [Candidatus Neomarinimicrobiota bacterium]